MLQFVVVLCHWYVVRGGLQKLGPANLGSAEKRRQRTVGQNFKVFIISSKNALEIDTNNINRHTKLKKYDCKLYRYQVKQNPKTYFKKSIYLGTFWAGFSYSTNYVIFDIYKSFDNVK